MTLTKVQINIINAKELSFKINAVAGSGKHTTLLEYAKSNKDLKILYLAYNKSLYYLSLFVFLGAHFFH